MKAKAMIRAIAWGVACVITCQTTQMLMAADEEERLTLYDRNIRRLQYERSEHDLYRGYNQPNCDCRLPSCAARSRYYEHNCHYNYYDYYTEPQSRAVEEPMDYPE